MLPAAYPSRHRTPPANPNSPGFFVAAFSVGPLSGCRFLCCHLTLCRFLPLALPPLPCVASSPLCRLLPLRCFHSLYVVSTPLCVVSSLLCYPLFDPDRSAILAKRPLFRSLPRVPPRGPFHISLCSSPCSPLPLSVFFPMFHPVLRPMVTHVSLYRSPCPQDSPHVPLRVSFRSPPWPSPCLPLPFTPSSPPCSAPCSAFVFPDLCFSGPSKVKRSPASILHL